MVQFLKKNKMVLVGKPCEICNWLTKLSGDYKTVRELIHAKLKNGC